jgi:tryptophan-rich sensory protein
MSAFGFFRLVACLALCLAVGFVGSRSTYPEITGWYASLAKPNGLRQILRSLGFALRHDGGEYLARVGRAADGPAKLTTVVLFAVQLVLNAAWPPVFFAHSIIS